MLIDQMEMHCYEVENLLIPKPSSGPAMHFQRRRLEQQHMAAVLQGGHVGIERLPVIANHCDATLGGELQRNPLTLEDRCRRMPTQCFGWFGLTKCLQKANTAAIGVQAVYVVEDKRLMTVFVGLQIDAQGCGLAIDPADTIIKRLADAAAFAD